MDYCLYQAPWGRLFVLLRARVPGAGLSGYVHIEGKCYRFAYDEEPVDWEVQLQADWDIGALEYIGEVE